jgi:Skp family chaperone for outer membrane proteins
MILRTSFALVSMVLASTSAVAQTAPASGATTGLGGTAVPGICFLSRQAVYANAKVGVAATARLQQLTQQAQAEVTAEQAPIDADLKAFQAEQAKLTPAQRDARQKALAPRVEAVRAKAQLRSREIEATREKALARISDMAQPVLTQAYTAKKCGVLMDRAGVLGGNLTNDLTPDVVRGLDAKATTITFDRETLPAK